MLFKVMIALAAYYVGRSGIGLEDFWALMERLIGLDDEDE